MSRTRRNFTAQFKAKLVAIAFNQSHIAFRSCSLEKLASERKEKAEYAKKVGQLTMQVDWL